MSLQRVEQRREHHHRGAVLVVVEDGDVQRLLEPVLDLEAARGRDVLEVDAAEGGGDRSTVRTISSTSLVSRQIGKASTPANSLNSIALPSMTGMAASGPMSPRPSTAEPSETTATVLRLIVYSKARSRSSAIAGRRAPRPACRPSRGRRGCAAGACCGARSCPRRASAGCCRWCRPRDAGHASTAASDLLRVLEPAGVDGDVADGVAGLESQVHRADRARRPPRWRWPRGRASRAGARSRREA